MMQGFGDKGCKDLRTRMLGCKDLETKDARMQGFGDKGCRDARLRGVHLTGYWSAGGFARTAYEWCA